ncbi:hypothetical protein AURDEDRAFT_115375 [Auricularia subglabra TFB-10046 SS5]|nr:hypothetical protein AURDEDRAFT_115375 [Auricularia subglabra TFB-10046 SS5]
MAGIPRQIWSSSFSRAAFNVASLGPGLVGLPVFLITISFGGKRIVSRGAVFLNFMVSVTLLGISFGLLALVGEQGDIRPSSRMLCFVQTALVDGALGMTPVSILALVIQLGFALYSTGQPSSTFRHALNIILIVLPYAPLVVFTLRDGMYFMQIAINPSPETMGYDVMNPAFYCKLSTRHPFAPLLATEKPLVLFIAAVSCLTLLVEVAIGYMLWRQWKRVRPSEGGGSLGSLVRLTVFTVYRIGILVIAIDVVRDPHIFPIAEFFHGAIPMVVFLIFGLQRDVLATWRDWLATALTLCSVRSRGDAISKNPPIKNGTPEIV